MTVLQKRVLALVPARGGSKGLPGKNIADLGGRPLIAWSIAAALECTAIDRVVVSTDDDAIAAAAQACGAEVPFMRPASLAADDTPSHDVVCHALDTLDDDIGIVVLLQPTSPLRTSASFCSLLFSALYSSSVIPAASASATCIRCVRASRSALRCLLDASFASLVCFSSYASV